MPIEINSNKSILRRCIVGDLISLEFMCLSSQMLGKISITYAYKPLLIFIFIRCRYSFSNILPTLTNPFALCSIILRIGTVYCV